MKSKRSKKFETVVCVLNIILMIFMVVYLLNAFVGKKSSSPNMEPEVSADSTMDSADDAMVDVYTTLIKGTSVKIDNDKWMYFGVDGDFNGFFDKDNSDVEGYSYEIIGITDEDEQDGAVAEVHIYNIDKSKFVRYKLLFGENSELLLLYPETGKTFTIEI